MKRFAADAAVAPFWRVRFADGDHRGIARQRGEKGVAGGVVLGAWQLATRGLG